MDFPHHASVIWTWRHRALASFWMFDAQWPSTTSTARGTATTLKSANCPIELSDPETDPPPPSSSFLPPRLYPSVAVRA